MTFRTRTSPIARIALAATAGLPGNGHAMQDLLDSHDCLGLAVQPGVADEHRNRDAEPEERRQERLVDIAGKGVRVAHRVARGHCAEGANHAQHSAQKTQQG